MSRMTVRQYSSIHIVEKTKIKNIITLDIYMSDPGKFEILDNGRIIEKTQLTMAQKSFRVNYHKIREFFD